jgi:hypothetical protein
MDAMNPTKSWRVVVGGAWLGALLAASVLATSARAAGPVDEALLGTWQGELNVNASTRLAVQFVVSRDDKGGSIAVLNAVGDANLQNIPVSSFSRNGDKVVIAVDEVNGRYEGTLNDKTITGKWTQSGSSFDLVLKPYVRAKIAAQIAAQLAGAWSGTLHIPKTTRHLALVLNFKADPNAPGGVGATIDSPDQATFGIPADDVDVQDGNVIVTVLRPKMGFRGRIEGNQLVGKWLQGGSAPLTFNKGTYQAKGLEVDQASRDALAGNWYGQFANGVGLGLSFKQHAGKFSGSLDSPYEGRRGIPISAVVAQNGKLTLRIDGIGASFSGTYSPNAIAGKFSAGGQEREVRFVHGEFVPESFAVGNEVASRLVGTWEAKTANTNMILRFQRDPNGNIVAVQDIPNRQLFSLPVSGLTVRGAALEMTVKGIAAEFKGTLSQDAINGDWTMPSLQFPLKFIRTASR